MDDKRNLLQIAKRKLHRFGVKVVYELRHTAEKSTRVTTFAPSPTPAVHKPLEPPVSFADVAGIDEVRGSVSIAKGWEKRVKAGEKRKLKSLQMVK